ncbi:hypothetical protein WN48_04403 [Eufriesea mexicana]|nr:hypothetical protein WN48_04403 [Eufriesea mexicana]
MIYIVCAMLIVGQSTFNTTDIVYHRLLRRSIFLPSNAIVTKVSSIIIHRLVFEICGCYSEL